MVEFNSLLQAILDFRDARDWAQFHNSKDLALGLSVEAAELLELFLWKQAKEVDEHRLKEELADVLIYCFLLAHNHGMDIPKIMREKLAKNAEKYPVEKAKGSAKKYDEL